MDEAGRWYAVLCVNTYAKCGDNGEIYFGTFLQGFVCKDREDGFLQHDGREREQGNNTEYLHHKGEDNNVPVEFHSR